MKRLDPYKPMTLEEASRPDWANGCSKCQGGLVNPPSCREFSAATYLVRLFQANAGRLTFCDCLAGRMYRKFLLGAYNDVKTGKDTVSDGFRQNLEDQVNTPTVHYEGTRR